MKNFLKKVSKKAVYFSIAGMLGALCGSLIGEIPFLEHKKSGTILSDNILETQKRVIEAGGKTGDIQVSIKWDNRNDLDLYIKDPKGEVIYFKHKKSRSGGELDVDRNVSGETITPVENIVWLNTPPIGMYSVSVKFFRQHDTEINTDFVVVVNNDGNIKEFNSTINSVNEVQQINNFKYDGVKITSSYFFVGLWGLSISIGISLFLMLSQRKFLKQPIFSKKEIIITGVGGATSGIVSSLIANYLFIFSFPRPISWGVMGLFLALFMTKIIPNLKIKSAFIGGFIGGGLFSILILVLDDMVGRMFGAMSIGMSIGTMIAITEDIFKEAWVEIVWNENEKVPISLGRKNIIVGSSKNADIYISPSSGCPLIVGRISYSNGKILYIDEITKKHTYLKDGNKIIINNITLITRLN